MSSFISSSTIPSAVKTTPLRRHQDTSSRPKQKMRVLSKLKMSKNPRTLKAAKSSQKEDHLRKKKHVQRQQVRFGLAALGHNGANLGVIGAGFSLEETALQAQHSGQTAGEDLAEVSKVKVALESALETCAKINSTENDDDMVLNLGCKLVGQLADASLAFTENEAGKKNGRMALRDIFSLKENVNSFFKVVQKICDFYTSSLTEIPRAEGEATPQSLLVQMLAAIWKFSVTSPEAALLALDFDMDLLAVRIIRSQLSSICNRFPQFLKEEKMDVLSPSFKGSSISNAQVQEITQACRMVEVCIWLLGSFGSEDTRKLMEGRAQEKSTSLPNKLFTSIFERLKVISDTSTPSSDDEKKGKQTQRVTERLLETGMISQIDLANLFFLQAASCVRKHREGVVGSQVPSLRDLCSSVNKLNLATSWCLCSFSGEQVPENLFNSYIGAFSTFSRILKYVKNDLATLNDHANMIKFSIWALSNLTYQNLDGVDLLLETGLLEPVVQLMVHKDFYVRWRAIRTIANLSTAKGKNIEQVIDTGVVELLRDIACEASYNELQILWKQLGSSQFALLCQAKFEAFQALANFTTESVANVEMTLFNDVSYESSFLEEVHELASISLAFIEKDKLLRAIGPVVAGARLLLLNAVKVGNQTQLLKLIRAGIIDVLVVTVKESMLLQDSQPELINALTSFKKLLSKCHCGQLDITCLVTGRDLNEKAISSLPKSDSVNIASYIMHKSDYWRVLETIQKENKDGEAVNEIFRAIMNYK